MYQLYTNLKKTYNLGNQYVQDCFNLIESDIGFELIYKDIFQESKIKSSPPNLVHEDFFKKLEPQNLAFRKYQTLRENDIGLEAIIFGIGMRKNKTKFNRING